MQQVTKTDRLINAIHKDRQKNEVHLRLKGVYQCILKELRFTVHYEEKHACNYVISQYPLKNTHAKNYPECVWGKERSWHVYG